MEHNIVYYANGNRESVKELNTLDEMMESYLNLLAEQLKLQNKTAKIEMEIKDIKSAINRELKFNSDVGRIAKADNRIFCCLKGEDEPIVIEVQE